MVTINCSQYEKNEFIRFLEYAKEQKKLNRPIQKGSQKFDTTDYDIERINILISRVNGNYKECYHKSSTKADITKTYSEKGLIKIL